MDRWEYEGLSAKSQLTSADVGKIWRAAARYDPGLEVKSRFMDRLAERRIKPSAFTRSTLFDKMHSNEPVLFSDFVIRPLFDEGRLTTDALLRELRSGFPKTARARVRTAESIDETPVPEVVDEWIGSRCQFGVTDLHYIGTRFDRRIDTTGLNDFNILPRGALGYGSQDSLVISAAGSFTDSHSDDHSGSNHSFAGTKLWLLWDIFEGFDHGLEDVERCTVHGRAAFEMRAFLTMRSSCWIFIGPGQTMFIPANLTHKVITLERYLGLGSFHAGLPGFLNLLSYWARLPPMWAIPYPAGKLGSVEYLTRRAIRRLRLLKGAGRHEQKLWGVPQMKAALQQILAKDIPDPQWTEAGRANIERFLIAASQI